MYIMKTRNIVKWLLLLTICILFNSCKKYLDAKSNTALVTPQTLKDLQGLMDDGIYMNLGTTPSYGESSADDYFLLPATVSGLSTMQLDVYTWTKTDYIYGRDWSKAYTAIFNSNLCLDLLGNIERTEANRQEWDNVKGSALFFRGYYYLLLNLQHGLAFDPLTSDTDLGIVLRESSDFNKVSVRSSVKKCYDQILSDITGSVVYLPDYPLNLLRPSKAAAYALLSRLGLYLHDYNMVVKNADLSLKLQKDLMDYNGDADIIGLTSSLPFKKFNKETIFYTEMLYNFGLHTATVGFTDSLLYSSYDLNDLRRTAFFSASKGYQVFKGNYGASVNALFSGLATDEVYLNRAEGKAFLGDVSGAMQDLNTLMIKRWRKTVVFTPFSADTKDAALALIRRERRKELLFRGLRWGDIKRYNKENANIVLYRNIAGRQISLEPNSKFYALPLPSDIIQITGLPQN